MFSRVDRLYLNNLSREIQNPLVGRGSIKDFITMLKDLYYTMFSV